MWLSSVALKLEVLLHSEFEARPGLPKAQKKEKQDKEEKKAEEKETGTERPMQARETDIRKKRREETDKGAAVWPTWYSQEGPGTHSDESHAPTNT